MLVVLCTSTFMMHELYSEKLIIKYKNNFINAILWLLTCLFAKPHCIILEQKFINVSKAFSCISLGWSPEFYEIVCCCTFFPGFPLYPLDVQEIQFVCNFLSPAGVCRKSKLYPFKGHSCSSVLPHAHKQRELSKHDLSWTSGLWITTHSELWSPWNINL